MKYSFSIRDVKSFEDCKPLQTFFYLQGDRHAAKIVYYSLLLKFPAPQYLIEIDEEMINFKPVNIKDL